MAGDGCVSVSEREQFTAVCHKIRQIKAEAVSLEPETVQQISDFINSTHCPGAVLLIWFEFCDSLPRTWATAIHPYVEKLIVFLALATADENGEIYHGEPNNKVYHPNGARFTYCPRSYVNYVHGKNRAAFVE